MQYDVKNAFVHANIDADIYTILPTGIYNKSPNKICHLNKALYGLKQSPGLWNRFLKQELYNIGFEVFPYDEGVYLNKYTKTILICHVDDILILNSDIIYIRQLADKIRRNISLDEIGLVTTFLGNDIIVDYSKKLLYINQTKYIEKILNKFSIYNEKPIKIPGEPGARLRKNQTKASPNDINQYQKEIGSLLYLALKTRVDITFPIIYCSRYMNNPSIEHFTALKRVWKYLLGSSKLGLIYNCYGDNLYIKGYCDSDWGNDLDHRKSTSGYIFSISPNLGINNPISWASQLQKTVALSSCEAEYMALKEFTKEAIYISNSFYYINNILGLKYIYTTPKILVDSISAKKLAENPEFHKRTKHIEIIYHYTRDAISRGLVNILQIPSRD